MAAISYTWTLILDPQEILEPAAIAVPSDSLQTTEGIIGNIEQPVIENAIITDDLPSLNVLSDSILLRDDAFGFVTGVMKTIYITDERYIIRHDS